jgi:hypothetical protein
MQWGPSKARRHAMIFETPLRLARLLLLLCKCSGVLAKRADMRWRRNAEDLTNVLCPLQVCVHAELPFPTSAFTLHS